jgi:CheY-like chemotaxis protein
VAITRGEPHGPCTGIQWNPHGRSAAKVVQELLVRFAEATIVSWAILVVEDDADVRDALADVLQARGYHVFAAPNGVEALARLQQEALRPDVILLDLMMPLMNGWELLDHLAADAWRANVPVVVITAQPNVTADLPDSVAAVLHKPLPLARLLETIEKLCHQMPALRRSRPSGTGPRAAVNDEAAAAPAAPRPGAIDAPTEGAVSETAPVADTGRHQSQRK